MRGFLIVCLLFVGSEATEIVGYPSEFLGHSKKMGALINSHLKASVQFLLDSNYYASQQEEKRGLSRLLMEESDRHWNDGLDALQLYLDIGGSPLDNNFLQKIHFTTTALGTKIETPYNKYKTTIKDIAETSLELVKDLSRLNALASHKGKDDPNTSDDKENAIDSDGAAQGRNAGQGTAQGRNAGQGAAQGRNAGQGAAQGRNAGQGTAQGGNAEQEASQGDKTKQAIKGHAAVAHYAQDKSVKETEIGRKMINYYIMLERLSTGIDLEIFDKHL